jgi:hypothetical protein
MDLRIIIVDENDVELDYLNIYQDGSDSEGAKNIRKMLSEVYEIEPTKERENTEVDYAICEMMDITIDELDEIPLEYVEQMRLLYQKWYERYRSVL